MTGTKERKTVCVLDWLEEKEQLIPNKIAVRDTQETITYKELAKQARKVASAINTKAKTAVLIYLNKSIPCFSAMLGVLYSGCFYSVLDLELPDQRIQYICNTAKSRLVITDKEHEEKAKQLFADSNISILCYEDIPTEINYDKLNKRRAEICDTDPMYCNFTSGSTGSPKGVLINHRSVIDFIPEFCETLRITSSDKFANQAPFDFDVSVKDMYSTLYLGAEVALIPRTYFVNPTALIDYLIDSKATTLVWAVSAMLFVSGMKAFKYKIPKDIKKVIFSGEIMPQKHLNIWKENLPDTTFINVYGPTEITCNCTYHILKNEDYTKDDIPIGKPFRNERVFLLDNNNKEIKEKDVLGEICVAGTCLAIGYIGADSSKSFVQNPLNDIYKETIYRTGDRGRYDKEGNLHYAGRLDFQIKHMGHRIELTEIEKQCDNIDGVNRSGSIYEHQKNRIVLFYEGEISINDVSKKLKETLPHFMQPSIIRQVDKIPISNHGKLDRKKLVTL